MKHMKKTPATVAVATLAVAGLAFAAAASHGSPASAAQLLSRAQLTAATTNQPASNTVYACVNSTGQIAWLEVSQPGHPCADNLNLWHWNVVGPKGDTGATGSSGVVATANHPLANVPENVATGGSFSSNKTLAGTVSLGAGTWLVELNFKATPDQATTGAVFPQMFVYNGPQSGSDFSGDLFNVGSGALEQFTTSPIPSNRIDSYYSGSAEITVPSGGETLDVYAFGYDSDGGAGSYELDSAVLTATQLVTS